MSEKYIPVHIRLTETQYERLRQEAFKKRVSQAEIVRLALEKYWEDEKMKEYEWIKQESDAEIYEVNGQYIKVVWGYSTGSETGLHNEFDTDVCVYQWTGEECEVDELPGAMDSDWEAIEGFDLKTKENSYGNPEVDWEDYAEKVNKILADVESGHY